MRGATTSAIVVVALLGLAGCRNEKVGPTAADYEAKRKEVTARAAQGQPGAPRSAAAKPAAAPATAPAAAPAAAPAPAPAAAPGSTAATVAASYTYDPTGKRDPFRSFVLDQARNRAERDLGPLEQFDISQLTVVAVVWDTKAPRALVADPSGRPYIVSEGTSVGKNDGRVIKIEDGVVLVKETYVDWLGERTTKDIEMRLHREAKGGDSR